MSDFTMTDDSINQMLAEIRDSATTDPIPSEPVPTVPVEPELEPGQEPAESDSTPEPVSPPDVEPPAPEPTTPSQSPDLPSAHSLTPEQYEQWTVYSQLDQRLRTDAEFAKRFQEVFNPQTPVAQDDSPEYSDPAYLALQNKISELNDVISRHDAIINKQQEIENQATMHRVRESFKALHSLDETQMDKVYEEAKGFAGALPQLSAQGVPLHDALTKVFESAYWTIPEFKEAEVQRVLAESQESSKRKAKAGSLSGSSGSVPRTATRPMNDAERRDAMIREFADAAGTSPE